MALDTIVLYRIKCTSKQYDWERSDYYSLTPWGENSYPYSGKDDGGHIYYLPPQFKVIQDFSCFTDDIVPTLVDKELHQRCSLEIGVNGEPVVVGWDGKRYPLKRSNVDRFFRL